MPILNRETMPSNHTKHHLLLTNSLKQYPHKMTASRRTTDKTSRQPSPTKQPPFAGRLGETGNQTYVPTAPTPPTRERRLCTVLSESNTNPTQKAALLTASNWLRHTTGFPAQSAKDSLSADCQQLSARAPGSPSFLLRRCRK